MRYESQDFVCEAPWAWQNEDREIVLRSLF